MKTLFTVDEALELALRNIGIESVCLPAEDVYEWLTLLRALVCNLRQVKTADSNSARQCVDECVAAIRKSEVR